MGIENNVILNITTCSKKVVWLFNYSHFIWNFPNEGTVKATSLYWSNLAKLINFIIIGCAISLFLIFVYIYINKANSNEQKNSLYECGFIPFNWSTTIVDIQFFRTSLLFLIFDVEVLILFPWALNYYAISKAGHLTVFFILALLTLGLIPELKSNAISFYPTPWNARQQRQIILKENLLKLNFFNKSNVLTRASSSAISVILTLPNSFSEIFDWACRHKIGLAFVIISIIVLYVFKKRKTLRVKLNLFIWIYPAAIIILVGGFIVIKNTFFTSLRGMLDSLYGYILYLVQNYEAPAYAWIKEQWYIFFYKHCYDGFEIFFHYYLEQFYIKYFGFALVLVELLFIGLITCLLYSYKMKQLSNPGLGTNQLNHKFLLITAKLFIVITSLATVWTYIYGHFFLYHSDLFIAGFYYGSSWYSSCARNAYYLSQWYSMMLLDGFYIFNFGHYIIKVFLIFIGVILISIYGLNVIIGIKCRIEGVYLYVVSLATIPYIAHSDDFIALVFSFELSTLALLASIGLHSLVNDTRIIPALGRYFLFSALSSAIYLFGCAWLLFIVPHRGSATLHYDCIYEFFNQFNYEEKFTVLFMFNKSPWITRYFIVCIFFLLIIFIYKLTFAPTSTWLISYYKTLPDYLVLTFLTVYKVVSIIALWKLTGAFEHNVALHTGLRVFIVSISLFSIVECTYGGYRCMDMKIIYIYTTITQNAAIVSSVLSANVDIQSYAITNVVVYVLHLLLLFAYLALIKKKWNIDFSYFNNFGELCEKSKTDAAILLIIIASIAGVPPFGGFFAKYGLLMASYNSGIVEVFLLNAASFLGQFVVYALMIYYLISNRNYKNEKDLTLQKQSSQVEDTDKVTPTKFWEIVLIVFCIATFFSICIFGFYFIPILNTKVIIIILSFKTGIF